MRPLAKVASILTIIAFLGGLCFIKDWDLALKISAVVVLTWLLWLTDEVIGLRNRSAAPSPLGPTEEPTLPTPKTREFPGGKLVLSRKASEDGEIPRIDSEFLDWDECTFCMWVKIDAALLSGLSEPKYIFSHTSDDNGKTYPDSFSLLRTTGKPRWRIMLHGDPELRKPALGRCECPSLSSDRDITHFAVRWSQTRGDVDVLINGKKRIQLEKIDNWPRPAGCPVFLGGWVRGGFSSYIGSKLYDVQVFENWLSDEQVCAILSEKPKS